ncbi:MAG TPA: zinc metalloprotease HtpX [Kofleriaceae bacterium]|nr:zinc metalloprotease HtpX [Kofleriaceae bacterium]
MASTTIRTTLLMSFLIALLGVAGWGLAGQTGLVGFALIGVAINVGAYWFSDRIALAAHRAVPLPERDAPAVHRIVAELAAQARIPAPPIYLIPSDSPNAFATGRGPGHAVVAVTRGLLELMDERELRGVLAHELSHVENRDVLVATIAAGIAGVIATLGHVLQWGLLLGGDRRDDRGSSVATLAWAVVAPVIALLLQLAISRAREYGADDSGAQLTGDPEGLASALGKLEAWSAHRPYERAAPATAHLFIVNPLHGAFSSLLSTHPPIERRIARLRAKKDNRAPRQWQLRASH